MERNRKINSDLVYNPSQLPSGKEINSYNPSDFDRKKVRGVLRTLNYNGVAELVWMYNQLRELIVTSNSETSKLQYIKQAKDIQNDIFNHMLVESEAELKKRRKALGDLKKEVIEAKNLNSRLLAENTQLRNTVQYQQEHNSEINPDDLEWNFEKENNVGK